ncbi:DUF2971 domain-containing protein [Maribellus sediminis]|uniref:DUF2971 domain-containing protein n=1 Tax=Maribellus sediminis TaxID=2696285 RepID=UPI00143209BD|nr:DUF2971 domain-containing protein [Maribellus sediminis]
MTTNTPPETLIKYYKCDKNSRDAFLNNYLWAAYPLQFNDPFDCSDKFWELSSFSSELLLENIPEFHEIFSEGQDNFQRRRLFIEIFSPGIICLNNQSNDNEDILWGYYSNQEGFCIEFNTKELVQCYGNLPVKVDYIDDPTQIKKCNLNNPEENMINWITTKKRIWENEEEWRFIFDPVDCNKYHPIYNIGDKKHRQKNYNLNAISRITFGYRFFAEQVNSQRLRHLAKDSDEYLYSSNDNLYKFDILSHAYEKGIELYHIDLTEDFKLIRRKIEILEIKNNKVTMLYSDITKK